MNFKRIVEVEQIFVPKKSWNVYEKLPAFQLDISQKYTQTQFRCKKLFQVKLLLSPFSIWGAFTANMSNEHLPPKLKAIII